jgi:outer membrane immunogenic protein
MKSRLFAFVAGATVVASAQIASAADLAVKAQPHAPAVMELATATWTGFYIGGHGGWAWGHSSATAVTGNGNFPVGSLVSDGHPDGGLGGVQGGYNYQFGQWVLGIEGDYSFADITSSDTTTSALGNLNASNGKFKWLADVTGRLGYAGWSNWLVYIKGGAAWTHHDASSTLTSPAGVVLSTSTGSEGRTGYLIGGGLEWAFVRNWSAKIEYNYMDFGTETVTRVTSAGTTNLRDNKLNLNVFKAGVNYRF